MKILYAIQGTGNGHLARATEIIPYLRKLGEVDILVSGIQGDIKLPFEIKYKFYGLSFIFGNKGGINFWQTLIKARPLQFILDIYKLPVTNYDLVLNDFEPVSAWACRLIGKDCTGISHQGAVLHANAPRPLKGGWFAEFILKYYAPANRNYGFHFKALDTQIFTPVIRSAIRKAIPRHKEHYTVYLPAFSDEEIIKMLSGFRNIQWEVFSKKCSAQYSYKNIRISPVSLEGFNRSFINCKGVLCNAGFETPAEALFMGKKLCVIPMKNQYEQACNAALLAEMGVTVVHHVSELSGKLETWISNSSVIRIPYPDQTEEILRLVVVERKTQSPDYRFTGWKILVRSTNWLTASIPGSSYLHQKRL